jgi:hypothetical protein
MRFWHFFVRMHRTFCLSVIIFFPGSLHFHKFFFFTMRLPLLSLLALIAGVIGSPVESSELETRQSSGPGCNTDLPCAAAVALCVARSGGVSNLSSQGVRPNQMKYLLCPKTGEGYNWPGCPGTTRKPCSECVAVSFDIRKSLVKVNRSQPFCGGNPLCGLGR